MIRALNHLKVIVWACLALYILSAMMGHDTRARGKGNHKRNQAQTQQDNKGMCSHLNRNIALEPTGARLWAKCLARERYGWVGAEWHDLNALWTWESGFRWWADNPDSSAQGIPQCLYLLHASCNNDAYFEDPIVQINWGLDYIYQRHDYGRPSLAWSLHQARCGSDLGCWY